MIYYVSYLLQLSDLCHFAFDFFQLIHTYFIYVVHIGYLHDRQCNRGWFVQPNGGSNTAY